MRIENNDEWFVYEGIPERKNKIKRGCAREWENETFFSLSLSLNCEKNKQIMHGRLVENLT